MVRISFACNDYRNGHCLGRFDAVNCGDIELEGPWLRIAELPDSKVRIGRRKFAINGSQEWVGNWCWNEYRFEKPEALRLFRYLNRRGYRCIAGPSKFFEAFNRRAKEAT